MTDYLKKYKSLFSTTLASGIGTGTGDTLTLSSVTGLPTDTPITITVDRVDSEGNATPTKLERITGTISGSNLTSYTRGVDGTTEQAHSAGAVIEMIFNAEDWNDMVDWGLVEHDQDGTHTSGFVTTLKATGAEINTGTEDAKIVTPKAIADSNFKQAIDEDDMASNLDIKVPTQQSVKAYVDQKTQGNLFDNLLINSDFKVWQEGTTRTTPNDDVYVADVYNLLSDGNGAWTVSQSTDVPAGVGASYSLKAVNVTANKQMGLAYFVENKNALAYNGNTASLSFYAKTTTGKEIAKLRATILAWSSTADTITSDVVGTWAGNGTDPTWATNWTAEVAGADKALTTSWQRFTIENISIDTASMANLAVVIWVDDTTITAGDEFYVTAIKANKGAKANTWVPKSGEEELAAIESVYEALAANDPHPDGATTYFQGIRAGSKWEFIWRFRTKKRTTPTLIRTGGALTGLTFGSGSGQVSMWNFNTFDAVTGTAGSVSIEGNRGTTDKITIVIGATSISGSPGQVGVLDLLEGMYIGADARL